jgi:hypothetical protein
MALAKATLKADGLNRIVVELYPEQQAVIGYDAPDRRPSAAQPDYDLGRVLPPEQLDDVAVAHATLTYHDGDFWVEPVDEHEVSIGQYEIVPGHASRIVEGDALRLGNAELTFHILELGPDASPIARRSVENRG